MKKFNCFILALVSLTSAPLLAEKILGSITIEPGIDLTFEAAARDKIVPETFYLPENKTDVHIEVCLRARKMLSSETHLSRRNRKPMQRFLA